jgi:hypothetical protein
MQVVALVYVMLPAYFANMAAAFAKFWPGWNRPISRRWLGDHKTVVGFLLGDRPPESDKGRRPRFRLGGTGVRRR